jgi:exopolysaccharide production protein ExoQ
MPPQLALLLCSIGVATLFYLDRDKSVRNSKALWIPVIWLGIAGSRPVTMWFGVTPKPSSTANLDGSPADAAFYGVLIAIGVVVLIARRRKTAHYLPLITPIIAYFIYCLISVAWSPVPGSALKRWIKDVGDVVMVLVIATDPYPLDALRRFYSRVGFIILPLSVTVIRYFTSIGRRWDDFGAMMTTGVATDKNMLGVIVFVISLGAFWNFRWLFVNKSEPNRDRRLLAQGILLSFGVALLQMAGSSTSVACFVLGSGIILVTYSPAIRRRPSRVHILSFLLILLGVTSALLGGSGDVAQALGRDPSFSGRTLIWAALLPAAANPIIGAGFESFWNSPSVSIFAQALNSQHWWHAELLNEAHNGYLEVYLNLGLIGLCLIASILATGYSRASKALRSHRELGSLTLAYIITGAIYSITEAGFRTMNPMWFFILLSVVSTSGAKAQLFGGVRRVAPRSISKSKQLFPQTEVTAT